MTPLDNTSSVNSVSVGNIEIPSKTNPVNVEDESKESQLEVANTTLEQLTKRRSSILNELSSLRSLKDQSAINKVQDLQKVLHKVNTEHQLLKKQVEDIQKLAMESGIIKTVPTNRIKNVNEATATDAPTLNKPNVLWGFVRTPTNKPLSDIVVIVKNARGEPVRATKTNGLGQFLLTTSLNTGSILLKSALTIKQVYA